MSGIAVAPALAMRAAAATPRITRGVNIPLWFDQPDGSSSAPSTRVLAFLREAGFRSIRLPLAPELFAGGGTPAKSALRDLAKALSQLSALGFSVSLDMHPQGLAREQLSFDRDAEDRLAGVWSTVAAAAASLSPDTVFLELLNEPSMSDHSWLALRERLAEVVRRPCPSHTIVWGASRYQSISETLRSAPLADANSIAAVHYYSPMAFTHQCQTWGTPGPWRAVRDLPFPADAASPAVARLLSHLDRKSAAYLRDQLADGWSIKRIDADFSQLRDWSAATGTPVIVNEFGASNVCTDGGSRARWTRAVRNAAERHGMGWIYWEFDRSFGFLGSRIDVGEVDVAVLASLVDSQP